MYSVWTRWAGLDLVVRVGPSTVTIVGRDGTRVQHPRKRFGERSIDYRHYLAELARKPQAVRQVLPDLLRDLGRAVSGDLGSAPRRPRAARRRTALRQGARPARHPGRRRRRARPDRRARDGDAAAARAHAGAPRSRARARGGARAAPRHRGRERLCGRLRRLARERRQDERRADSRSRRRADARPSNCPASRARLKGSPAKPAMRTGRTKTICTRS